MLTDTIIGGMGRDHGAADSGAIAALREMRRARRRRYVEQIDVMDVLYRIYLAAIFGAIALGVLAGVVHDAPATPAAVEWLRGHGPAAAGAVIAAGVLAGLRAGAHGGPLAIEGAEVQYVLLAPLRRGVALRPAALRQLRVGAFGGAVFGAILGNFVFRRLPGPPVEWILCLALFAAFVPLCFFAAGLVAAGRRWASSTAGLLGLLLFAWSGADLALGWTSSPASMLGELATMPLQEGAAIALAGLGTAAAAAFACAGLLGLGNIRLEAAKRRAALSTELRFSASVQDLRTVVLLRRQLASERPRRGPWLRLEPGGPTRHPVWRRGWQSLLRWPLARVVRVVLIGVAAGTLAAGAWSAAPLALFVPGILLFVAGLDLVEPLAQEADHPTRRRLLPSKPGTLIVRQLTVPVVASAVVVLIATGAAAVVGGGTMAIGIGLALFAPVGLGLACCAAFGATSDPYAYVLAPELGLAVSAAPPIAASMLVGGPLFTACEAQRRGEPPEAAAIGVALFIAIVAAAAVPFLGQRFARRDGVPA